MGIKFLTVNIWFGGKLWESLIPFIHEVHPDILCIQEVYDGHDISLDKRYRTMEEFRHEFGGYLPHDTFGATTLDTSVNVEWGNAVFSKFPIRSSKTIFFDLPYTKYDFEVDPDSRLSAEGMQEAEIDINGKRIFVYSWHGVWNNHGEDTPERKLMEKAIIENISNKKTVILAGDTNMNPTSGVIKNLQKELPIVSVFGESFYTTFNLKQKDIPENYAHSPVDMIFVSRDIKVLKKEMPQADVSDHMPLVIELELSTI